jgi:hypothetical protein
MRSVFVYARLIDGVEHFAIGEGVLPPGCKQVGCFGSLAEARAHRDRLRSGKASMPSWTPTTQHRASNASHGAFHAIS